MADNIFDDIQDKAVDIVHNTMGYDATWTPSAGGPQQTARVLFKNPSESKNFNSDRGDSLEYTPYQFTMEYKEGDFPTLKSDTETTPKSETVTVKSVDYLVSSVIAKWDGKTLIATLEPK